MRRSFLLDLVRTLASLIFKLLSLSYSGALRYHTTDPIKAMEDNCDYKNQKEEVIQALSQFRQLKQEELRFVNKAVSGALEQTQEMKDSTDLMIMKGHVVRRCCNRNLLMARH